jgi:hypothetical protein
MQPIRQPSFADILEDVALDLSEAEPAEAAPTLTGQDWLFHIFAAAAEAAIAADASAAAYRESAGGMSLNIHGLSEEDRVAAELDLGAARSLDDLARIRRAFARKNHPDMLHPGLSDQATGRMKIANMMINRRARELKARG